MEFFESDTLELLPGQGTYEQVHKELLESHGRGLDLITSLAPFSRVVPGEKRFMTTLFRLRKWDIYDDAISTLNRMKVRIPWQPEARSQVIPILMVGAARERTTRVSINQPRPRTYGTHLQISPPWMTNLGQQKAD